MYVKDVEARDGIRFGDSDAVAPDPATRRVHQLRSVQARHHCIAANTDQQDSSGFVTVQMMASR